MDLAAQEIAIPLGTELRLAHEEQRLGLTMPEALEHMAGRTTSRDLRYFVSAINIQHEVGGNLAEVMENISLPHPGPLKFKGKNTCLDKRIASICHSSTIFPVVFFLSL